MKKLLASILLGAVAGMSFVQYFDRNLSPDIGFFRRAAEQSDQWAAKLRESGEPCYVICGSSDVRMGVDPETMAQDGVRAINASINAGYGRNLQLVEALHHARPGDTLVLVPLPKPNDPGDILTGSMKLGFIRHGFGTFEPGLVEPTAGNFSKIWVGDIRTINTYMVKKLMVSPTLYRYNDKTCRIHTGGWVELYPILHRKRLPMRRIQSDAKLPEKANDVYDVGEVAAKCKEKGLDFIIRPTVGYGDENMRALSIWKALQYVRAGYRVLKEPSMGIETDISLMADTPNHLNAEGARKHSRAMAQALKNGDFWTESELVQELGKRGWDANGMPIPGFHKAEPVEGE